MRRASRSARSAQRCTQEGLNADGLQPVRRHALSARTTARTRCGASTCSTSTTYSVEARARADAQPERDGAHSRRDGEMHLLRAANQRGAQIGARKQGRRIRDGEVCTACQQSVRREAIVFGDLERPGSRSRERTSARRSTTRCWKSSTRVRALLIWRASTIRIPRSRANMSTAHSRPPSLTVSRARATRRVGHRKISALVLRPARRPLAGSRSFCRCAADAAASSIGHGSCSQGRRHLGHQHPGRLGLRDRELRLVDRHRARRNVDLRVSAACCSQTGAPRSIASPKR